MNHPAAATLALALAITPAAAGSELAPTLASLSGQLNQVWRDEPVTTSLQPPRIRLRSTGGGAGCPSLPGASAPQAVQRCQGEVVLDPVVLQNSFDIYKRGGVAFWVALGLAETLQESGSPSALPGVAARLQSLCLAGTLLGAIPAEDQDQQHTLLRQAVKTARVAYAPTLIKTRGTPGQRAYAVLTGTGGTGLTCSTEHMLRLSAGDVPDPERISSLSSNRDPGVGIESFCRQPPACPRRLATAAAAI